MLDVQPRECPVDVKVLWDRQPADDAAVAARGPPQSLRLARGGKTRLRLRMGRHTIVVGSGDRVAEREVEVKSYQPTGVVIDLVTTLLFESEETPESEMFRTIFWEALFEALRHLKYNKHEVILFHTYDAQRELNFDFDNRPKRFIDVETGESINLYADTVKDDYKKLVAAYFKNLKLKCMQYKIDYVPVDITKGFDQILITYLISRQRFL